MKMPPPAWTAEFPVKVQFFTVTAAVPGGQALVEDAASSLGTSGRVVAECAVAYGQRADAEDAAIEDSAAVDGGRVAAQGAVRDRQRPAVVEDSAAVGGRRVTDQHA